MLDRRLKQRPILVTPATASIIDIASAKAQCRIDSTDDDTLLKGNLKGTLLKHRVIGFDEIGEARTELLIIGPDERIDPHQVDMVFDHDQIPLAMEGVHAARGIGDDQNRAAKLLEHPDGVGNLSCRVPLVEVKPTLHGHHGLTAQPPAHKLAFVADHRGLRKVGDFWIGNGGFRLDLARQAAKSGSQDNSNPRLTAPASPHRGDRFQDLL